MAYLSSLQEEQTFEQAMVVWRQTLAARSAARSSALSRRAETDEASAETMIGRVTDAPLTRAGREETADAANCRLPVAAFRIRTTGRH